MGVCQQSADLCPENPHRPQRDWDRRRTQSLHTAQRITASSILVSRGHLVTSPSTLERLYNSQRNYRPSGIRSASTISAGWRSRRTASGSHSSATPASHSAGPRSSGSPRLSAAAVLRSTNGLQTPLQGTASRYRIQVPHGDSHDQSSGKGRDAE